jgi:signal transduction histidine kinase
MTARLLAFAPNVTAATTSRPGLAAVWTYFSAKRTKSTTKRIGPAVDDGDIGVRELDSILRDIAELRSRWPRADGMYINSETQITLASGRTLSKATLFRVLQVGGWLAFGTFVLALNIADIGIVPSAVEQLIWVSCGGLITLAFRGAFHRACATGWSYTSLIMLAAAMSVVAGPIWYVAFINLLRLTMEGPVQALGLSAMFAHEASEVAEHPRWWPPIGYWMFFTSLLSTWCSLYFGIKAMLDLEAERARSVRALKLADSARLRALQSQLNPHFLFNALNGIATLVREGDRSRAAATVETLSDFLRLTLEKLDLPEIAVREELTFVEQYLHIQRLRFGSAFGATVEAPPETLEALVPTLILQPLVENAVRHGVLARAKGGSLSVSIQKRDEVLVMTVEDDGPGLEIERTHAYGVGFKNTAERLAALYGDDAHMSVGARPHGRGFVVVVFLPFRQAPIRSVSPARVTVPV